MMFELDLKRYNFKEYKRFDVSVIKIDQAVRDMCKQNACGQYGANHMCPPAIKDIGEWKEDILSYENALIVTKVYPTKDSFDRQAMFEGIVDFQEMLVTLKEDMANHFPERKTLVLGAGACFRCKECTYKKGEPCRFPEKAIPSLEACGIDVMSLSKSARVNYNNGKNTVTYLGALLYQ